MEDRGRTAVQMIPAAGGASRVVITGASHIGDVQFAPDGKTMIYAEQTGARPTQLFRASSGGGAAVALDNLNEALLAEYPTHATRGTLGRESDRQSSHP